MGRSQVADRVDRSQEAGRHSQEVEHRNLVVACLLAAARHSQEAEGHTQAVACRLVVGSQAGVHRNLAVERRSPAAVHHSLEVALHILAGALHNLAVVRRSLAVVRHSLAEALRSLAVVHRLAQVVVHILEAGRRGLVVAHILEEVLHGPVAVHRGLAEADAPPALEAAENHAGAERHSHGGAVAAHALGEPHALAVARHGLEAEHHALAVGRNHLHGEVAGAHGAAPVEMHHKTSEATLVHCGCGFETLCPEEHRGSDP